MPNFCLIPTEVDRFKNALVSGDLNPAKLAKMTSEERRVELAKHVGETNAKDVNALFESKLLLKNQERGMVTWARQVAGLKPTVKQDMISRIQRIDHILSPEEHQAFLEDLAAQKLGMNVTESEAKSISELGRRVAETEANVDHSSPVGSASRMAYGHAVVEFENHVLDLKSAAAKQGIKGYLKHPVKTAVAAAGQTKAINASMDNSAIFRQGWKTLFTNPVMWQRAARQSFRHMAQEFGGHNVMDEVRANLISRPNAINGMYNKMKLDIGNLEEPFPTHLPSKIYGLGRLYRASESAYTGFVFRMRADVADKYLEIAQKSGVNLSDPGELKSIGKLTNSLTGRGSMGFAEPVAGKINNVFFSPRFMKSNWDFLTGHNLDKGTTTFVRKQAALNLAKAVTGTAAILGIADAVKPGSVEWDPRSANFGKIKIGDTRFDVTGGMDSIVTLAARMIPHNGPEGIGMYSKSSITNQVSKINSQAYGATTGSDVVDNFFENKLSPVGGLIRDFWLKGVTPQGTQPTVKGEASNLVTPLSFKNWTELKSDPNSANNVVSAIADGLGIVTNTYGQSTKDWNQNTTKSLQAFKQKVGQQQFNQANQKYNTALNNYVLKVVNDPRYKSMSQSDQQATITAAKTQLQDNILQGYGFKYKRAAPNKAASAERKSLMPGVLR